MGMNLTGGSFLPLGGGSITGTTNINDDVLFRLGTDGDDVLVHRTSVLNAATALTSVLVGTPVSQALAANSLITSNVTASGDLAMYGNLGGNSQQFLFYDTSASLLYLMKTLVGRDDSTVATNAVTDSLVVRAGAGASNEAAEQGVGIALWVGNSASEVEKRGAVNCVLDGNATNGTEYTRLDFWIMANGALGRRLAVSNTGIYAQTNGFALATANDLDGRYFIFQARDNDTDALVEIARLQSAAIPYLHIGAASSTNLYGVGIKTDTVTMDHASHAALNATDVTDNALVWQQPAGSVLLGIRVVLTEQFAASGLSDIDITLGENGGDADGWLVQTMNGTSDAAGTQYKTRGALWDTSAEGVFSYVQTATDIYGFVTATGANLNTLTAGTWTVYFTYLDLP